MYNIVCISGNKRERLFSSLQHSVWMWGQPSFLFNGQSVFSSHVKHPRHQADHLPSPSRDLKNEWSYTSTLPVMPSWCTQGQLYIENRRNYGHHVSDGKLAAK
jgi:hypothetical protein